jgi:hypothetical protein
MRLRAPSGIAGGNLRGVIRGHTKLSDCRSALKLLIPQLLNGALGGLLPTGPMLRARSNPAQPRRRGSPSSLARRGANRGGCPARRTDPGEKI